MLQIEGNIMSHPRKSSFNEDQTERAIEREINRLDVKFMNGDISQAKYDLEISEIDKFGPKMIYYTL